MKIIITNGRYLIICLLFLLINEASLAQTYCASSGNTTYETSVTLVTIGTIYNASAKPSGYSNYTAISTNLIAGSSYNLTVNVNTDGNYWVYAKAWIDWNQNGDFTDAGEEFTLGRVKNTSNGATNACPMSINTPVGALAGATRMRISAKYDGYPTSCQTGFDGEVEDYTLTIISTAPTISGFNPTTACSGSNTSVTITGTYFTGATAVSFNGIASAFTVNSSTQITATLPASASTGAISVTTPSGTASSSSSFIVQASPTITGITHGSKCGPGIVTLGATASAGTINWYASSTGGSSIATGTSFTTASLSATTTYYVDANSGGCTSSPRVAVVASIIPPASIVAGGGGSFCTGANVNLTSSGTNITNQYWTGPNNFYSLSQNPAISSVTVAAAGTYTVTGSSLSGVNLVANGDFEAGNMGFSSSYGYVAPTTNALTPEGVYTVVANPNSVHSGFTNCIDHSPAGTLQMVINGTITAGVDVWKQTVNVTPNTDYQFTYWVQSVVASNPSQLQLYVNGISAGPTYTAITATCQWAQFAYNWNSGASTTAILSLKNQNIIAYGNDFALDDIVFQQACSASSSVVVAVNVAAPSTPGTISGTTTQCPALTGQIYSISAVTNATTYTWTVPTGWAITSGAGTTSITVTTGSTGQNGNITVRAGNGCGTSAAQNPCRNNNCLH